MVLSSAYLFLQVILVITGIENIAKLLIIFDQFTLNFETFFKTPK